MSSICFRILFIIYDKYIYKYNYKYIYKFDHSLMLPRPPITPITEVIGGLDVTY